VAAETQEITPNSTPVTHCNYEGSLDHLDELLHAILARLDRIASPENLALLDRLTNNPAMRWSRRNGRTPVQ
jgi:hypothetical protein